MGVPIVYRKAGEGAVATYDFFDIASGTGIIQLFGALNQDGNGVLTNENIYSNDQSTDFTVPSALTKSFDKDFDVVISNPTTFKGTATINIPFFMEHTGVNTVTMYTVVNFSKWNGTTETVIATDNSSTASITGTILNQSPMFMIQLTIPTTVFKSGETLRMTVEAWTTSTTNIYSAGIGHDPQGRLKALESSTDFEFSATNKMIFNLPIRIDL